ncbi:MAG TPA: amino acid permease [Terriglobales bacterium]|nr:amino acid permease [Terriglobales bacterium]
MTTPANTPSVQPVAVGHSQQALQRRLSERQLAMIAIGGAIGVGLFLGSTVTINQAGPSVIVTYLLGAALSLVMAYALAEMAVVHPVAGSFGIYAERYLNPWFGFTVRTTYGLVQIVAVGAEVTAVAIYFQYWFPTTPQWIWVALVSAGVVAINSAQVGNFGEFEYWFALIKVVAIIVFIVIGIALIAGLSPRPAIGFRNLVAYGGFLPHGWLGMWLALTLAVSSYMGIEVIAVTAGEARRPEEAIPRAMRTMVFRLILFYVLAIGVMVTMTPWNQSSDGTISGSPFVRAFAAVGVPYAAAIMNLVVITAALSSVNTDLYLSTRMLFSLARGKYAPALLGRLSKNGVPHRALAASSVGMAVAILLAIYAPKRAFLLMYGSAVAGMYFVWIVILLAHLRFRREIGAKVNELPLRLRMFPLTNIAGIAMLIAIAGSTFYVEGLQYSVPIFALLLAVMTVAYWRIRNRTSTGDAAKLELTSESSPAEP